MRPCRTAASYRQQPKTRIALAYSPSGTPLELALRRRLGALAELRRRALELRRHPARLRPGARDLPGSSARLRQAGQPRVASAKTVAAVERLAKADRRLAATAEQWDANGWVLQHRSRRRWRAATFDLRTGVGRARRTRSTTSPRRPRAARAPAGTPHPLWTHFSTASPPATPSCKASCSATSAIAAPASPTEHVFVFAYGTGANGKSTFINTIAGIFGDYADGRRHVDTFIASNTERHPTDLAKLRGARLVVAQETQKGRRWDETKIKALTGGDKITARFMRQDFFDFVPTFKLFICGNHKPRLTSVDEAMRRRLLLVPFTVQIPPAERDPRLAEKLQAEWPAILRWCIDGCLEWQRIGLAPPAIVRDATEDYFADQDTLQQWLDDCTEDGGQFAFSRTADLFASWKTWCEGHNLKPGSAQALSESSGGSRLRKSPQQHRPPRVPQPCRKTAMTAASDRL